MKTRGPVVWLAGALLHGLLGHAAVAADYHVDFARGDDTRDGLSAQTAWRHAPGDKNAGGRPAATTLRPGDSLRFAAGVRYRGAIKLNGGGSAERPLVITSAAGATPGVIDGSDPATNVRPCRSAEDCGGSPLWRTLTRAEFDTPLPAHAALFTETGRLYPAQTPAPADPFNPDDAAEFLKGDASEALGGALRLAPGLAKSLAGAGEGQLVFHVQGNEIALRSITAIEGDVARFDPQGLRFGADQVVRYAALSHPAFIQRPGEYGVLPGRTAVVIHMPPGASSVSAATGRSGIDLTSQSHVEVRGLSFENMADDGVNTFSGVAIFKSAEGSDISIEQNRFNHFRLQKGNGPLALNFITRLGIRDNRFQSIGFGSGMRLYKDVDVEITGNTIRRIGRTGILVINVQKAVVSNNVITQARGIHGNAMSAYIDNEGVRFVGNVIADALRPITIGHATRQIDNALLFQHNIVVGTEDSLGALTSWGNGRGVTIQENVLIGGKSGLDLSASDTNMVAVGNVMNGAPIVKHRPFRRPGSLGYIPDGWRIADNRQIAYFPGGKGSPTLSWLTAAIADAADGGRTGAWRQICDLLKAAPAKTGIGKMKLGPNLECPPSAPK